MREFPVLEDWAYTKCGTESYHKCENEEFIRQTLQSLYTIISPGGMKALRRPLCVSNEKHLLDLANEISTLILGGVPESFSEYT